MTWEKCYIYGVQSDELSKHEISTFECHIGGPSCSRPRAH